MMARALATLLLALSAVASGNTIIPADPDDYEQAAGRGGLFGLVFVAIFVGGFLWSLWEIYSARYDRSDRRYCRSVGDDRYGDTPAGSFLWSVAVGVLVTAPFAAWHIDKGGFVAAADALWPAWAVTSISVYVLKYR